MTAFARELGRTALVALVASVVLGIALALFQREDVVEWIAYGMYIGGGLIFGIGFLTGPESPRKRYVRERVLKQPAPPGAESKLITFGLTGLLLVGAGTLVELVA